ncbi:MAG: hypothetical protein IPM24_00005, partial [Bryobacterales bacterium]|nr:hypothetical protein [Bryobacterales bacterium]
MRDFAGAAKASLMDDPQPAPQPKPTPTEYFGVLSLAELRSMNLPEPRYRIAGLLRAGESIGLIGQPK